MRNGADNGREVEAISSKGNLALAPRREIIVEDDGPGIPEADREKAFNPFVRLEASRNRDTGGAGPGLSIARSIFRGHGGDITHSDKAPGLRVCLRLPALGEFHASH